jgi:hypothetical protein
VVSGEAGGAAKSDTASAGRAMMISPSMKVMSDLRRHLTRPLQG